MPKIIDIRTREKWTGPKSRQGAARMGRLTANEAAYVAHRGENGFEQVGSIADRVISRLKAR